MYSISTNTLIFILFDIVSFCSFNILCFAFFKKKVNLYKLLILCVFTVMVTTFIYIRYPSINIPCSITLKLINVFMYSSSIWKNILLVLFQSILSSCTELIACYSTSFMLGISINDTLSNNLTLLSCEVLYNFGNLLFALYLYKIFTHKKESVHATYHWTILILSSFLSLYIFFCISKISRENHDSGYMIMISVFLLLTMFNSFIFYSLDKIDEYHNIKKENETIQQYMLFQEHQIEIQKRHSERIHTMQHDMKHIFRDISILLEQQNYAEIEKLLANRMEYFHDSGIYINTCDCFINALFNYELSLAYAANITWSSDILIEQPVNIAKDDLSLIICNLFDNVLEYFERTHSKEPSFYFQLKYIGNVFIFEITNPVEENIEISEDMSIKTSKDNHFYHGFGLRSIIAIVKKLNGVFKLSCENGYFTADVFIDSTERKDQYVKNSTL